MRATKSRVRDVTTTVATPTTVGATIAAIDNAALREKGCHCVWPTLPVALAITKQRALALHGFLRSLVLPQERFESKFATG